MNVSTMRETHRDAAGTIARCGPKLPKAVRGGNDEGMNHTVLAQAVQ